MPRGPPLLFMTSLFILPAGCSNPSALESILSDLPKGSDWTNKVSNGLHTRANSHPFLHKSCTSPILISWTKTHDSRVRVWSLGRSLDSGTALI